MITDSPCHGKQYHDEEIDDNHADDIPENTLENLLKKIIDDRTNLVLSKIADSTNKMFEIIKKTIGERSLILEELKSDNFLKTITSTVLNTVHKIGKMIGEEIKNENEESKNSFDDSY